MVADVSFSSNQCLHEGWHGQLEYSVLPMYFSDIFYLSNHDRARIFCECVSITLITCTPQGAPQQR